MKHLLLTVTFAATLCAQPPVPSQMKPRHPQPPFPYQSVEVTYKNPTDGTTRAGTLTIPRGNGPFPAVVFVQGSAANAYDRDYIYTTSAMRNGYKPGLIIADYLTRQGIAVLRTDDRGVGKSTGNKTESTVGQLSGDMVASLQLLKQRKEIDARRIGIAGHSFAGLTVSEAAAQSPDWAFVITLAGSHAKTLERNGQPLPPQAKAFADALADVQATAARDGLSLDAASQLLAERLSTGGAGELSGRLSGRLRMSDFFTDPSHGPSNTRAPFLAIYGSADTTNNPITNIPALVSYLTKAKHPDFSVQVLPGLDHTFFVCTKPVPTGGKCEEEKFSPKVLKLMSDWILDH